MLLNTTAEHIELHAHFMLTAVHDSVKWFINICASFWSYICRLWNIVSSKTMQLTSMRSTFQRLMLTHLEILLLLKPSMSSGRPLVENFALLQSSAVKILRIIPAINFFKTFFVYYSVIPVIELVSRCSPWSFNFGLHWLTALAKCICTNKHVSYDLYCIASNLIIL